MPHSSFLIPQSNRELTITFCRIEHILAVGFHEIEATVSCHLKTWNRTISGGSVITVPEHCELISDKLSVYALHIWELKSGNLYFSPPAEAKFSVKSTKLVGASMDLHHKFAKAIEGTLAGFSKVDDTITRLVQHENAEHANWMTSLQHFFDGLQNTTLTFIILVIIAVSFFIWNVLSKRCKSKSKSDPK